MRMDELYNLVIARRLRVNDSARNVTRLDLYFLVVAKHLPKNRSFGHRTFPWAVRSFIPSLYNE